MSIHRSKATDRDRVPTSEHALVVAYDVLTDAGCESVVTETPHRTTSTWIVPATCGDGECEERLWRVHIDPRSGSTRAVAVRAAGDA